MANRGGNLMKNDTGATERTIPRSESFCYTGRRAGPRGNRAVNRTLLALAVGAALGAAATYALIAPRAGDGPTAAVEREPERSQRLDAEGSATREPPPPQRAADVSAAGASTAERAAAYEEAAAARNAAQIEALVTDAASARPSARRTAEIEALLLRFAEFDARRAIDVARSLRLGTDLVAPLYGAWAAEDLEAALGALRAFDDPAEAGAIGLAMLEAPGGESAFARIVAALERGSTGGAGVFPASPATSPFSGPARQAATPGALALERLAEGWARQDLSAALAHIDDIEDQQLRAVFQRVVLREWAYIDAGSALEYLTTLDPAAQQQLVLGGGIRDLSRVEPRRALELAERLSNAARMMVQQDAIGRLAQDDALTALRYVEELPAGPQRQQLQQFVAVFYGRQDPEGALAWARRSGSQYGLVMSVMQGIATTDLDRAFMLTATLPPMEREMAMQVIVARGAMPGQDPAAMAERVLALQDATMRDRGAAAVLQTWSAQAPQQAMDWLLRNLERVPPNAARNAVRQIAARDPATAAAQTARIPSDVRGEWIAGVAIGYGQSDAQAGVSWLAQFRGEPGYEEGVEMLAPALARSDGPAAARLVETVAHSNPQFFSNAAVGVAQSWAQQNPQAAVQWVMRLDRDLRSMAIPGVTATWATADLASARTWALGLSAGQERDVALGQILSAAIAQGAPADRSLGSAFSNNATFMQAFVSAIGQLAQSDPARARIVIADHLTDPAQRERAEQMLERMQNGPRAINQGGPNFGFRTVLPRPN